MEQARQRPTKQKNGRLSLACQRTLQNGEPMATVDIETPATKGELSIALAHLRLDLIKWFVAQTLVLIGALLVGLHFLGR
jgi:hypothetical protein